MTKPSDNSSEGAISINQLQDMWVSGKPPIEIAREKGISPKELFRRLKEIQRPLVEKAKVKQ